jgi:hypothetical protein
MKQHAGIHVEITVTETGYVLWYVTAEGVDGQLSLEDSGAYKVALGRVITSPSIIGSIRDALRSTVYQALVAVGADRRPS